jgi:choline dehydrogenase-like flavoprotein
MLSGIGDATNLEKLGIDCIVDLPEVGANLSDHAFIPNPYVSPHATEAYSAWLKADKVGQYIKEWEEKGTGPLTSSIGNHMAFLRLPESDEHLQKYGDPSAGPTSPHFELLFVVSTCFTMPSVYIIYVYYRTARHSLLLPRSQSSVQLPLYSSRMLVSTSLPPLSRFTDYIIGGSVTLSSADPFTAPVIDPNFFGHPFDVRQFSY